MRKKGHCLYFLAVVIVAGFYFFYKSKNESGIQLPNQKNMKILSDVFKNNEYIPKKYTCGGEDVSPSLNIEGAPSEAKSLVLIVDDPDARMGNWNHWIVWNIDPLVSVINDNSVPKGGIEGMNDFRKNKYGGPCPPSGTHHYHFKIYALDTKLELDSSSKKSEVERAMNKHILDWSEIVGLYKK